MSHATVHVHKQSRQPLIGIQLRRYVPSSTDLHLPLHPLLLQRDLKARRLLPPAVHGRPL